MKSKSSTRMSRRRRPLHTCGTSAYAIARKAYRKSQNFNGPLGTMAKRVARLFALVSPLLCALMYQWVVIFSLADDCILALERRVECIFPPSKRVFKKIDSVLREVETLPGKFDNVVNEFPAIMQKVPMLGSALVHAISWLNFFISTLDNWGLESMKEKEITVDTSCSENNSESSTHLPLDNTGIFPPVSETQLTEQPERLSTSVKPEVAKGTYKEALEKGTKENVEKKIAVVDDTGKVEVTKEDVEKKAGSVDENKKVEVIKEDKKKKAAINDGTRRLEVCKEDAMKDNKESQKAEACKEEVRGEAVKDGSGKDDSLENSDPILDLFESGWLMSPVKDGKGSPISKSASFT